MPFIACIALVRGVPLAAPVHLHTGSSIQTRSQDVSNIVYHFDNVININS